MRILRDLVVMVPVFITAGVMARAQTTNTFPASGNVGIGTTAPAGQFQVMGSTAWDGSGNFYFTNNASLYGRTNLIVTGRLDSGNDAWNFGTFARNSIVFNTNSSGVQGAAGTQKYSIQLEGNSGSLGFLSATQANSPVMALTQVGFVGIGTTSPSAKLEVNGNLKLTSGSGSSITFPDGTVQSTAYTGVICGGDYAESVDVAGDRSRFSPGDLLVIDPDNPSKFLKSAEPYSAAVAGIYSTKPGTVGRRQTTPKSPDEVPMAVVGIVPARVSAENGPIRPSDLLVASSTPGYAMKGTDRTKMLGAVVGKAMGSLESGKGVIEALVTLQ